MAKKYLDGAVADVAAVAEVGAVPERTPENHPVPGGGRYRWDKELTDWVDRDAPAVDASTVAPVETPLE